MESTFRILISVFLIFTCHCSFGQTQDYFSSSSPRWFVQYRYPNANEQNPYFIETKTVVSGFAGDTVIENETWHKFYQTRDSSFATSLTHSGYIRSEQGIVLFQDKQFSIDTLYNFNLEIGDSVLYKFQGVGDDSAYITVQDIETVQINGNPHKQFVFDRISRPLCCLLDEVWIEGIGSVYGPLAPVFTSLINTEMSESHRLSCLFSDDILIWHNEACNNCYEQKLLDIPTSGFHLLRLFPNPFQKSFILRTNQFPGGTVEVVNIHGEIVRTIKYVEAESMVDLSNMPDGIYLVRFLSSNISVSVKAIKSDKLSH